MNILLYPVIQNPLSPSPLLHPTPQPAPRPPQQEGSRQCQSDWAPQASRTSLGSLEEGRKRGTSWTCSWDRCLTQWWI